MSGLRRQTADFILGIAQQASRLARRGGGWPAVGVIIVACLVFRIPAGGKVAPAHGDVPAYLAAAYHLRHDGVFSMSQDARPAVPEIGREPLYPVLLAGVMAADPAFGSFDLGCLKTNDACPASIYTVPRLLNLLLIVVAGVSVFLTGRLVSGWRDRAGVESPGLGLVAAAYFLANTRALKGWGDLMSDWLAVSLAALVVLLMATTWIRPRVVGGMATGLAFAGLTLTKAIFLPAGLVAAVGAAACAVFVFTGSRMVSRQWAMALLAGVVAYLVCLGGWAARNYEVSGMFRLTDSRSGIALSTRAVFDEMTARDYAASVIYWSGPAGSRLARKLFGVEEAEKFNLTTPGGYYDVGQNGYEPRVRKAMAEQHLDYWKAAKAVDADIVAGMRVHWSGYLLSMVPLIYRGLGIDEFMPIGAACLVWAVWHYGWRRDMQKLLVLGFGLYNVLAYAAVSLNIPRYQETAMPSIAIAVGLAAGCLAHRLSGLLGSGVERPRRAETISG